MRFAYFLLFSSNSRVSSKRLYPCHAFHYSAPIQKSKCHRIRNIFCSQAHRDANVYWAQETLALLAEQNPKKTLTRLTHMIELASMYTNTSSTSSIADIGCDHGLLSFALASSGQYHRVTGVDVSHQALHNGAFRVMKKVQDILNYPHRNTVNSIERTRSILDDCLEFRLGNGLECLHPGEANAVCIAGMGVENMIQILSQSFPTKNSSTTHYSHSSLHHLGTQHLFLQPNPSKPRNLVKLYQALDSLGWVVLDERIQYVASRWYITSAFKAKSLCESELDTAQHSMGIVPGQILTRNTNEEYQRYVQHHISWILLDQKRGSSIQPEEDRWLNANRHLCT